MVAHYLEQHLICLTNSNQIWMWNSFIFSWQSKISIFKENGKTERKDSAVFFRKKVFAVENNSTLKLLKKSWHILRERWKKNWRMRKIRKHARLLGKYLRVIMTRLFLKKFSFETPFSWFSYLLSTGQINNIYNNKTIYSGVYTMGVLKAIPFRFPNLILNLNYTIH